MSRGCNQNDDELAELRKLEAEKFRVAPKTTPSGSWGRAGAPTSGYKGDLNADGDATQPTQFGTCCKCKERPAEAVVRQSEQVCPACGLEQLSTQVVKAARLNRLVMPGDRVLVAVSGGAGSTAVLSILRQLQSTNKERPERNKVVFQLIAVHVDESAVSDAPSRVDQVRQALGPLCPAAPAASPGDALTQALKGALPLLIVPLEAVLADDVAQPDDDAAPGAGDARRARLGEMVSSIPDRTGREDLLAHLRSRVLDAVAGALGCNRVARGDSATRCAVRFLAESCKGRGYAVPGEIQFSDARGSAPSSSTILPAREVLEADLGLYCRLVGLEPLTEEGGEEGEGGKGSINALCEGFVATLQKGHPATVTTILRTASKLLSFDFNDPSRAPPGPGVSSSGLSAEFTAYINRTRPAGNTAPHGVALLNDYDGICGACRGPIPSSEGSEGGGAGPSRRLGPMDLCESCAIQIAGFPDYSGGQAAQGWPEPSDKELEAFLVRCLLPQGTPRGLRQVGRGEMRAALEGLILDEADEAGS